MILVSSILVMLLLATPNADAQKCDRWNICYKQTQQQQNSALQETVTTINRTLSAQNRKIDLLEKEKSNSFTY